MRIALAAAAVALVACAAQPAVRRFAPDDRTAIAAVLDAQAAAWNRGDITAFMDGYARTPQLVFTSGGNIRRGWQDALDHYKARYATDAKAMGTLQFTLDQIDPLGADHAAVLGHWQLTGPNAGHGVFTLIFEHRPEGWRIIHDHTSEGPKP